LRFAAEKKLYFPKPTKSVPILKDRDETIYESPRELIISSLLFLD